MDELATIKDEKGKHTFIIDGSGTIVDGKFTVTGNWKKKPKEKYTYHISTNNGREWDSPLLDFADNTGSFNPPD